MTKLVVLTALTLVAFAANSLLGRAALLENAIDPASFTLVRLSAGAAVLGLLCYFRSRNVQGSRWGAFWLLVYALPFSFAYVTLATGTGALLLFAFVQATMVAAALRSGESMSVGKWVGLLTALCGLVVLVLPGVRAPDPGGAILMATAGIGWGMYSLWGRRETDPLAATSGNFLRTVPVLLLCWLPMWVTEQVRISTSGLLLGLASGGITSGLGYALWYSVLPRLSATTAATVQLSVPLLASLLGALALREELSLRLMAASALILGGIFLVVLSRRKG